MGSHTGLSTTFPYIFPSLFFLISVASYHPVGSSLDSCLDFGRVRENCQFSTKKLKSSHLILYYLFIMYSYISLI